MNGIRLAVFALVAICFSQLDLLEAAAQGPPPNYRQQADDARKKAMKDKDQDKERGRSGRSRRSNKRSMSVGDNAIKTNPLFQLFDENGDGELSLEEIDAASRLLYSLDANEDDRITSDEVEDMATAGKMMDKKVEEEKPSRQASRNKARGGARGRGGRGSVKAMGGPSGAKQGTQGGLSRGSNQSFSASPNARGNNRGSNNNDGPDDDDFAGHDRDDDGVLKRGELPSFMRKDFRKMDENGDGEVDEDEFYDFIDG